ELPDNGIFYAKPASGFADAHAAITVREAVARDGIQQALPVGTVLGLGRQPRRQGNELVPCVFKERLPRLVRIDEPRVWIRVVRKDDERRVVIKPVGSSSVR